MESILRDGLQPLIGPRSQALGERVPRIYLFTSKDDCETALGTWLGNEFEDVPENGLVILQVVTGVDDQFETDADFEVACAHAIKPGQIVAIFGEDWMPYMEVRNSSRAMQRLGN